MRSAIITCLSLTLLLRADNLLAHPIAAAAAISSKSLFRFRGKHLFNPATFGIIFAIIFLPGTWVSPGQWGQDFAIAGWVLMLGMLVTNRARRGDISWTFLAFYLGALATARRISRTAMGRVDASARERRAAAVCVLHDFRSDDRPQRLARTESRTPHSSPQSRTRGRFRLYHTNGLIWALFIAAPCVPLWDAIWPARKFEWTQNGGGHVSSVESPILVSVTAGRALILGAPHDARAFCGFYVGKADGRWSITRRKS